jgi:hypothetical protein
MGLSVGMTVRVRPAFSAFIMYIAYIMYIMSMIQHPLDHADSPAAGLLAAALIAPGRLS